jgi:hypothetical protein
MGSLGLRSIVDNATLRSALSWVLKTEGVANSTTRYETKTHGHASAHHRPASQGSLREQLLGSRMKLLWTESMMRRMPQHHLLGGLPLFLLLLAPLPYDVNAAEVTSSPSLVSEQSQQRQRFVGVWALVDNANNLFNVRLSADGNAISTSGTSGVPLGGSRKLEASQIYEQGRWQPWGNGVRIDYRDGWSDAIVTVPAGTQQWSWRPGLSRLEPPSNYGKAVQLKGAVADAVGVYRIQPAQENLPVTTVSLLSNGLAFNAIDQLAGGVWHME